MRRALAILVLAWCWACAASAQPVLQLGNQGSYNLGPHVAYLEDPTARLTVEDVAQASQQARFRAARSDGPAANFGLTRSAIWLRIALQAPPGADPDWLLELAYPPLDRLELYVAGAGGGWSRQVPRLVRAMDAEASKWRNGIVVIRIGGNDFANDVTNLDLLAKDPQSPVARAKMDMCLSEIRKAVAMIHHAHPQTRIVLVGVFNNVNWERMHDQWHSPTPLANISKGLDYYDDAYRHQLSLRRGPIIARLEATRLTSSEVASRLCALRMSSLPLS
jgi:hypothetical protein